MLIKFIADWRFINQDLSTRQKRLLKNYLFQASIVQYSLISFHLILKSSRKITVGIPILFLLNRNTCRMHNPGHNILRHFDV